jgi:predicted DNA-binding transcriptional regulator AlpA
MARVLLSFKDLVARGLFKTRTTLKSLQKKKGFPRAHQIGPRNHKWYEDEIEAWEAWIANQPNDPPLLRGAAKASKAAKEERERLRQETQQTEARQTQSPDTAPEDTAKAPDYGNSNNCNSAIPSPQNNKTETLAGRKS